MNSRAAKLLSAVVVLGAAGAAWARPGSPTWTDPRGDAAARRTGADPSAAINPAGTLPDLLRITLVAWESPAPHLDPYNGSPTDPENAHLFRLDLVFDGLVNPPGPLDGPFEPFMFGPSPVYGFLDLDVDREKDTGGELHPASQHRYLANVGRFGRVPQGSLHERTVDWGSKVQGHQFGTSPRFEQSGEDFALVFCGCYTPVICVEGGNNNHRFDAGETWIVRSDFFQRAGGYVLACSTYGGVSGVGGMYDPAVKLRFSHSTTTNQTTITLVYALDNIGAGLLAGEAPQIDDSDAGNQSSVREALLDLDLGIQTNQPTGPTWELCRFYDPAHLEEYLDPTRWKITAIFGTSYAQPQPDAFYVWTDTGVEECPGDLDGDGAATLQDLALIRDTIVRYDGTDWDGDGTGYENGAVKIRNFGPNFSLYDINGDGWIDQRDGWYYCLADFNADGGVNINDLNSFLSGFSNSAPRADVDHNGRFDIGDFVGFSAAFAAGCP